MHSLTPPPPTSTMLLVDGTHNIFRQWLLVGGRRVENPQKVAYRWVLLLYRRCLGVGGGVTLDTPSPRFKSSQAIWSPPWPPVPCGWRTASCWPAGRAGVVLGDMNGDLKNISNGEGKRRGRQRGGSGRASFLYIQYIQSGKKTKDGFHSGSRRGSGFWTQAGLGMWGGGRYSWEGYVCRSQLAAGLALLWVRLDNRERTECSTAHRSPAPTLGRDARNPPACGVGGLFLTLLWFPKETKSGLGGGGQCFGKKST